MVFIRKNRLPGFFSFYLTTIQRNLFSIFKIYGIVFIIM